jgi:hypothetical protein
MTEMKQSIALHYLRFAWNSVMGKQSVEHSSSSNLVSTRQFQLVTLSQKGANQLVTLSQKGANQLATLP